MSSERTGKDVPAVSIVIPTYNHAEYLQQALHSVVNQTFHDWEAIIVNNFSDDATLQIIEQFNEPRFRVINFHNHGVIAASRNEGIRNSSAPVIAFLDSDDTWYKDKLSKCMSEFENGADVVCHGENWISDSSVPRAVFYGPAAHATYRNLLFRGNCISTSATLVNREVLEQLSGFSENPTFITAEDYELWIRLSLATSKFVFVHEILGEFFRHDKSASSSVDKHLASEIAVINHHVEQIHPSFMVFTRARHRRAKAFYSAGRTQMRDGSTGSALSFFAKALVQSPIFFRTYVAITLTLLNLFRRRYK
jgi:teichuronic acid biosynthesis glycosyltransferase TuaG